MPERLGSIPFTPVYGQDVAIALPERSIFIGVQSNSQTVQPWLTYRHPWTGAQPRYVNTTIRAFGNNETIPDEYFPIMNPLFADHNGMIWYITRREMN